MTEQNESFKDRQKRTKAPLQFALYKGARGKFGALRIKLKKAYQNDKRDRDDGCVFLEMAPSVGNNIYDWENSKIIMALGITDIPKIILYLRSFRHPMFKSKDDPDVFQLKLYHDKGAGTNTKGQDVTTFTLNKPDGKNNFFATLYQKSTGKTATVTVSPDEAIAMGILLQAAIPLILAWWPDAPANDR